MANLKFHHHWFIGAKHINDYMHRWLVRTPWFTLRIHHILRSDNERDLHDHPFDFTSFIFKGSYTEVTDSGSRVWKRFSLIRKKAEESHRLILQDGSVWTFVVTGPMRRMWGFYTDTGWVPFNLYGGKA